MLNGTINGFGNATLASHLGASLQSARELKLADVFIHAAILAHSDITSPSGVEVGAALGKSIGGALDATQIDAPHGGKNSGQGHAL